jgi:hypothetical protein
MFKNIGKKIQASVKIILNLGLFIGTLILIISIIEFIQNAEYLQYAGTSGLLGNSGDIAKRALYCIWISISMLISSFIVSFPIYGFGILIENSDMNIEIQHQNNLLLKEIKEYICKDE